jgi:hypothetical protein
MTLEKERCDLFREKTELPLKHLKIKHKVSKELEKEILVKKAKDLDRRITRLEKYLNPRTTPKERLKIEREYQKERIKRH